MDRGLGRARFLPDPRSAVFCDRNTTPHPAPSRASEGACGFTGARGGGPMAPRPRWPSRMRHRLSTSASAISGQDSTCAIVIGPFAAFATNLGGADGRMAHRAPAFKSGTMPPRLGLGVGDGVACTELHPVVRVARAKRARIGRDDVVGASSLHAGLLQDLGSLIELQSFRRYCHEYRVRVRAADTSRRP